MDVFGGRWTGYMEKLRENLKVIGPEDTTVLLGDLSWAMSLDDAAEDFAFMNAIPGRQDHPEGQPRLLVDNAAGL